MMKLLSRTEEFILLAVISLKSDAYTVRIRKKLREVTAKSWSYGALFTSLEQMVKKGYLRSFLTEPMSERGGRRKRIYQTTPAGLKALQNIKEMEKMIWDTAYSQLLELHDEFVKTGN